LVAHGGEPGEHVFDIDVRIFAVSLTGNDDRVDDGRALTSVRVADEQPVFLPNRRGPDRIFNEIVI